MQLLRPRLSDWHPPFSNFAALRLDNDIDIRIGSRMDLPQDSVDTPLDPKAPDLPYALRLIREGGDASWALQEGKIRASVERAIRRAGARPAAVPDGIGGGYLLLEVVRTLEPHDVATELAVGWVAPGGGYTLLTRGMATGALDSPQSSDPLLDERFMRDTVGDAVRHPPHGLERPD
jgi:hypothetical protein